MSKILIEEYRGWDIYFDKDRERFFCQFDEEWREKQSYPAAKKYIDDYIKENAKFEPFDVVGVPAEHRNRKTGRIVGVRKDGFFNIESSGSIGQLPKYDEVNWMLDVQENKAIILELDNLDSAFDKAREDYRNNRKILESNLVVTTVKDKKAQLKELGIIQS